ncbi:hypothetical protein [Bacillus rhizoplanae]|uniref:hypothetical protein n=1 Tax=Bacillus rhizoplanae TaxID=2880966 RepID=UPI003D1C1FAD
MVVLIKYKAYIVIGCVSVGIFVAGVIGWNGRTEAVQNNKNASSFKVKENEKSVQHNKNALSSEVKEDGQSIQHNDSTSSFEVKEYKQGIHRIYNMYGIENQIGFIKKPIVLNQSKTYDWFLWGNEEQIINQPLKITAIHPKSKQEIQIADIEHISRYDKSIHSLYENSYEKPNILPLSNSVQSNNIKLISHQTIDMKFPQSGKWDLYVLIGDKKLPPISIEVTDKEEIVTPLK